MRPPLKLLFLTPSMIENSLGRTFALWLAAKDLGWESRVVAAEAGDTWAPLREHPFVESCSVDETALLANARWADLIVAVKPLPGSFGRGIELARISSTPLLLDIDDPDLDARLSRESLIKAAAKLILRPRKQAEFRYLDRMVGQYSTMFSNPALAERYGGGPIVPHARPDTGHGASNSSTEPRVIFVGTNRPHKGVPLLRRAIGHLAAEGFTLTVTDVAPGDANPWESWIGQTSFERGQELVSKSDIVVIPSSGRSDFAQLQLPAKLMDAMIAARAIVVSDLGPLLWATDGTALSFRADDEMSLVRALSRLRDPATREELGSKARARALRTFTTTAVAASFAGAAYSAIDSSS